MPVKGFNGSENSTRATPDRLAFGGVDYDGHGPGADEADIGAIPNRNRTADLEHQIFKINWFALLPMRSTPGERGAASPWQGSSIYPRRSEYVQKHLQLEIFA
jgi:hypothetical protein